MFGIFDGKESTKEAKIFFGSKEESREDLIEIKNPFSGEVVSKYPKCDASDAKKALQIAQEAFKITKNTPLSHRIAWLEDVAKKLKEQIDDL